jgi:PIN domain nuclease of toxin-antitoxin system
MPDPAVLDASALLAYLRDEPGAGLVADAIARGTTISSVNLAEVLAITADRAWGAIAADVAVWLTLIR